MRQFLIITIIIFSLTESMKSQTFEDLVINCDSIYKTKGYKITLKRFDIQEENEYKYNSVFIISKLINEQYLDFFRDSIFVPVQEIKFEDFNNDNIKDILIQHYSDVRSNWTYYLYLVDTVNDRLTKVKGFEEIKNPKYNSEYDIIENYVLSGTNWTRFYKLINDKIIDLEISIYDEEDDIGNNTYNEQYKKALININEK